MPENERLAPMIVHKTVHEYDGAYKCLDCQKSWGALPGNPNEPSECIPPKPMTLKSYLMAQCHNPEMQAKLEKLFGLAEKWNKLNGFACSSIDAPTLNEAARQLKEILE